MNKRYLCSRHVERTPSVVVYPDHGWCFGCAQKIPLDELGVSPQEAAREASYVEDLKATLDYIANLPKKEIRGFNLPFNERGYYIVFPTADFYKFRSLDPDAKSKYRGPSGHTKPPFIASEGNGDHLALVEGELNALSLASLEPACDVISPGGAGDFFSTRGQKDLAHYARYHRIDVVVDDDAAGAQAAIETKSRLITLGAQDVRLHLVKVDFNDVHTKEGKETLRRFAASLGLV